MITIVIFLASCILAVCLYSLHKIRNVHLMLFSIQPQARSEATAQYRQLERLLGLYVDLGLSKSLPTTRGWAASPDFLMEILRYAQAEKPRVVVECSCGTSTVVLARCMQMNGGGKVYSLEHDPVYAQETRVELARHGLSEFAEVLIAPLHLQMLNGESWTWYGAQVLPPTLQIDMLVIDGPPQGTGRMARYPAGPVLFPKLGKQSAVFLDDAAREDEKALLQRWQQEFPALRQSQRFCEKGCALLRPEPDTFVPIRKQA